MPAFRLFAICSSLVLLFFGAALSAAEETKTVPYGQAILDDSPVLYFPFEEEPLANASSSEGDWQIRAEGSVKFGQPGPQPAEFPCFTTSQRAAAFNGKSSIRITDPGENSPLDFTNGDAITIEAWVSLDNVANGAHAYVLGKGRTSNSGFASENQNYALRLTAKGGQAHLSFLFRNEANRDSTDYHRWTSQDGIGIGDGWHHVAVTYEFGKPKSIRGYVDGVTTGGKWDMGGATDKPPVVDDDEVWIGSTMAHNASNSLKGHIDEVALYRTALPAERLTKRFAIAPSHSLLADADIPTDRILVEVVEKIPDRSNWNFRRPQPTEQYMEPAFVFVDVPWKYTGKGIREDRSNPFLLRATTRMTLPAGEIQFLARGRSGVRLSIDGESVLEVPFHARSSSAHQEYFAPATDLGPDVRPLQPGDTEKRGVWTSDGKPHRFQMETVVGGGNRRPETGETFVAWTTAEDTYRVLGPEFEVSIDEQPLLAYLKQRREDYAAMNSVRRAEASREYAEYWNRRHEWARGVIESLSAPVVPGADATVGLVHNAIDRFIGAGLQEAGLTPTATIDDWSFLRRACLDVIGTVPDRELTDFYFARPAETRRNDLVDRLLEHPGWADHWTGYWQDVLAENPNLVNPTLNNTGPFRWWLHESFTDNKPLDRMVTELVLMEGSSHFGGTAGFGLATQNDVPMAAKAHVLGQAFLGVNMSCARCHDAPFHDIRQGDLFGIAAMLKRGPQQVPATSTIPGGEDVVQSLLVEVTLKPGEKVAPEWPFHALVAEAPPESQLQSANDSREQLAAIITSPENRRFPEVAANRLWHRYFGHGLVNPVDDWEAVEPSHPQLLHWLGRELATHDYDLKHLTRIMLQSHLYHRAPAEDLPKSDETFLFAGPAPRRLSAEQILDSLFVVSGKALDSEAMNIDVDGSRAYTSSLNLGQPERAWQFTSLSNERDRPSLALPYAQTMLDVLETFGWRGTRQNPLTIREQEATMLQPAIVQNGVVGLRTTQLSDDSRLTEIALTADSVDAFITRLYQTILTREPQPHELSEFRELLAPGFDTRLHLDAEIVMPKRAVSGVSWSNHLKPEANLVKIQEEQKLREGDPPTKRLDADWRERAEDLAWVLLNSPEFMFLP